MQRLVVRDGLKLTVIGLSIGMLAAAGLIERGVGQTQAGDLTAALRSYDRAVEHRPAWPYPYYQRAWTHFLLGDSAAALEDYRACAKRTPVFFTVQRELRCLESVAAGDLDLDVYRAFCAVRDRVRDAARARPLRFLCDKRVHRTTPVRRPKPRIPRIVPLIGLAALVATATFFATLRDWFATDWPFDCLTFIVSQQETRQAALLSEAGLEQRLSFELGDGRPCWLYG